MFISFEVLFILFKIMGKNSTEDILKDAGLLSEDVSLNMEKDKMNLVHRKATKKMGAPRIFEAPEELHEWYIKYIQDIKDNPIHVKEFVGKDAIEVYKTHYRPPSWKGFEAFLFREGVCYSLDRYRRNVDSAYEDFIGIIHAIGADMFDTKYSGGALNLWNHNIIAKEMHLAEPIEIKNFERPILENGKELPKD